MKYVVFLGAPSPSDTSTSSDDGRTSYQWRTITPTPDPSQLSKKMSLEPSLYPSSALDAASRRISAMYGNIIFRDKDDEDEGDTQVVEEELTRDMRGITTIPVSTADLATDYGLLRSYDLGHDNPTRRQERVHKQTPVGCFELAYAITEAESPDPR